MKHKDPPIPHKGRFAYKTKDRTDLLRKEINDWERDVRHTCRMDVDPLTEQAECIRNFEMLSPFRQIEAEVEAEAMREMAG